MLAFVAQLSLPTILLNSQKSIGISYAQGNDGLSFLQNALINETLDFFSQAGDGDICFNELGLKDRQIRILKCMGKSAGYNIISERYGAAWKADSTD